MADERRYECPKDGKTFASIGGLKTHMERKHQGYTDDEIAAAVSAATSAETSEVPSIESSESIPDTPAAAPPPPQIPTEPPVRMTRQNRELNEKFNQALQLVIKHLVSGPLDEMSKQNLSIAREEIFTACVGVEFDFEKRLFTVSNKVAMIVGLLLLYFAERLPTVKDITRMFAERKQKQPVRVPPAPIAIKTEG